VNLEEKASAVAIVLKELDSEIQQFQNWSHLHCKVGCGKCCFKPDIEATPLEFLPFAVHMGKTGQAEFWLNRLETLENQEICTILNPLQSGAGLCSEYVYRGLICRLFGFSARTNKYDVKELVTCSIIKTEQQPNYEIAEAKIKSDGNVPLMREYYLKLHFIDPNLANEFMPINQAIRKALNLWSQYSYYKQEED
jgi:Fe-S-cluster containining protein